MDSKEVESGKNKRRRVILTQLFPNLKMHKIGKIVNNCPHKNFFKKKGKMFDTVKQNKNLCVVLYGGNKKTKMH